MSEMTLLETREIISSGPPLAICDEDSDPSKVAGGMTQSKYRETLGTFLTLLYYN